MKIHLIRSSNTEIKEYKGLSVEDYTKIFEPMMKETFKGVKIKRQDQEGKRRSVEN